MAESGQGFYLFPWWWWWLHGCVHFAKLRVYTYLCTFINLKVYVKTMSIKIYLYLCENSIIIYYIMGEIHSRIY